MSIKRINQFPDGSGTLTNDDIFLIMDDPSGGGITKKISLLNLYTTLGSGAYALSSHNHAISDVTGLQTALDNKQASGNYQPSGNYALSSHNHAISGVTGLQTALDLKAPLASPTFTGNIDGPGFMATSDTNSARTCFYGSSSLIMTSGMTIQFAVTSFGIVSTGKWMGTPIEVAYGGTGATTATGARTNLQLDNNYITNLGNVSGSTPINCDPASRSIQTLTLGGTATTFTKGTGWPTSSSISVDTVLRITVTSATSITWTIVNDWFNQPAAGALSIGTHLFLLRAIGSSIIEGHYIGSKTN